MIVGCAGLSLAFSLFALILWCRHSGSRFPNSDVGQLFPLDVSLGRGDLTVIVYLTHGYSVAYNVVWDGLWAWIAMVLLFTIYAIIVGRSRSSRIQRPISNSDTNAG